MSPDITVDLKVNLIKNTSQTHIFKSNWKTRLKKRLIKRGSLFVKRCTLDERKFNHFLRPVIKPWIEEEQWPI